LPPPRQRGLGGRRRAKAVARRPQRQTGRTETDRAVPPRSAFPARRRRRRRARLSTALGGLGETQSVPSDRAARPQAASSVAPIASCYWRSLRPCLGTTIAPRRRATFHQALLVRKPGVGVGGYGRDLVGQPSRGEVRERDDLEDSPEVRAYGDP